jgi:hypothetical protein
LLEAFHEKQLEANVKVEMQRTEQFKLLAGGGGSDHQERLAKVVSEAVGKEMRSAVDSIKEAVTVGMQAAMASVVKQLVEFNQAKSDQGQAKNKPDEGPR